MRWSSSIVLGVKLHRIHIDIGIILSYLRMGYNKFYRDEYYII
jgi:hypothetical protein